MIPVAPPRGHRDAGIGPQVNLFLFDRCPGPLDEDPDRPFREPAFALFNLVGINIKLLCKIGEALFGAYSGEGQLCSESRTGIPVGPPGLWSSPMLGKKADVQADISPNLPVRISQTTSRSSFATYRSRKVRNPFHRASLFA